MKSLNSICANIHIKLTNFYIFSCIGLIIALFHGQVVYGDVGFANIEKLSIVNNQVTIDANNISLKEVLQTLCVQANIQLQLKGSFTNKVNISISNQPIEQ